jgi:mRNA-degrading endonuclease toxin of MazEF toxin-antitoxin module
MVPGYRRPVVIVQANEFNLSCINTVIVAVITSNLRLAEGTKLTLLCPTYILIHFDVGEGDYEGRRDRFTG